MKPTMQLKLRISVDVTQTPRFSEEEIRNLIQNNETKMYKTSSGSPLLVRKKDNKIIGEFLKK